jgi:formate dehydrogenase iron-sulfur subunit
LRTGWEISTVDHSSDAYGGAEAVSGTLAVTPLDRYLAEQRSLTTVARFAQYHEADLIPPGTSSYSELLPLERPGPGQQYAFEVDLDSCTGCKSCVTACHSLNGLDDGESWRSVGLLHGGSAAVPFQQTVTTACHHCVEPACLTGCPVDAYQKDARTGIVRHLDDQCIGCRYCMLTCPYEVPRFNSTRGIVRKCDLCAGRLEAGEAPACAQACPNGAIRVTLVDTAAARARAVTEPFLPGAPDPRITVPTTRYRSARPHLHEATPADILAVRPAAAHPPLAVMLVLTQLSVGTFLVELAGRTFLSGRLAGAASPGNGIVVLALALLALSASVLHLGRPAYAYRAVLGFRHSWLSREIMGFGAYASLAAAVAGARFSGVHGAPLAGLEALVAVAGVVGVACSVMVYAATRRTWWRGFTAGWKFGLTAVVCGLGTFLAVSLVGSVLAGSGSGASGTAARTLAELGRPLAAALAAATALKLAAEASVFRHLRSRPGDLWRTALLLRRDLGTLTRWRFGLGLSGGVLAPLLVLALAAGDTPPTGQCAALAVLGLGAVVAGELCERSQFFQAVAPPRMPGNPG